MVPVPALAAQGKVVQGPDFSNQSRDTRPRPPRHLRARHARGRHHRRRRSEVRLPGRRSRRPPGQRQGRRRRWLDDARRDRRVGRLGHRPPQRQRAARRILNLSFGTPPSRYQSDLLAYAVEQAWKAGIVVVVFAGNEGDRHRGLTSPGYDPFILTIGADDLSGTAAVATTSCPRGRAVVWAATPTSSRRAARSRACATRTPPSTSRTPRPAWATTCSRAAARRRPPPSSRARSRCCSSAGPT